jgi:hypothetical protein
MKLWLTPGMSSLKAEDAIADYSSLNEGQLRTLDQWEAFFTKVRGRAGWWLTGRDIISLVRSANRLGKTTEGTHPCISSYGPAHPCTTTLRLVMYHVCYRGRHQDRG